MKKNIHEEVEKTLSSIEQIGRVEANPYLFNKIQERLSDSNQSVQSGFTFLNPRFAVGFLSLLFIVNIYAAMNYLDNNQGNSSTASRFGEWYGWAENESSAYNFEMTENN